MTHLDGQVAIVTGAGRGTGAVVAAALAAQGARVLAVDEQGAASVVEEIVASAARPKPARSTCATSPRPRAWSNTPSIRTGNSTSW